MVYNAYIDDSKDRHGDKVIVSGIFIGDRERWSFLSSEWMKILRPHGMKYFKTAEYYGLRGEFQKFQSVSKYPPPGGREAAREIFDALEQVIQNARLTSLGIVIPVQEYKEVFAMPESHNKLPANPYHAALNSGFYETVKAINRLPGRHKVAFVHDEHEHEVFSEYQRLYLEFKRKNPKTARRMGGFVPLNDEEHPPLQAADLAANVTCNFAKQWLDDPSKASLQRLKVSMYRICVWERSYILEVLRNQ